MTTLQPKDRLRDASLDCSGNSPTPGTHTGKRIRVAADVLQSTDYHRRECRRRRGPRRHDRLPVAISDGKRKQRRTHWAPCVRPSLLLATIAGSCASLTHKMTKLMHKVQIVRSGAANPRMVPFPSLVVLTRHHIHGCRSFVSPQARSYVEIKEDVAGLQAGSFAGA
jgi:hypothetical protein